MVEPKGRPKTLVRRHVIEIKEDTREWIEDQLETLTKRFILGKATRSVGEVLKGTLSHPLGFAAVATPIIVVAVGLWERFRRKAETPEQQAKEDREALLDFFLGNFMEEQTFTESIGRIRRILEDVFGKGGPIFGRP